jgi:hypothetical protein
MIENGEVVPFGFGGRIVIPRDWQLFSSWWGPLTNFDAYLRRGQRWFAPVLIQLVFIPRRERLYLQEFKEALAKS